MAGFMDNAEADVASLDEKEYVLVCHKNKQEICFRFSVESIKKSVFLSSVIEADRTIINSNIPIMIKEGDVPEFNFIMKYLDFYGDMPEADPPEQPLPRDRPINEIFEFEYFIFKEVLDTNNTEANVVLMAKVIHLANYLEMEKFYKKACAIIGFHIQLIPTPEERKRITDILRAR